MTYVDTDNDNERDPDEPLLTLFEGTEPWQSQSFLHGVIPSLRNANLGVMINSCSEHLIDGIDESEGASKLEWNYYLEQGKINFDPTWKPYGETGGSTCSEYAYLEGKPYTDNSVSTTPYGWFQEWTFMSLWGSNNHFDKDYWLQCLVDMDQIKNSTTPCPKRRNGVPRCNHWLRQPAE